MPTSFMNPPCTVKARPACAKAFARTATAGTYVLDDMCGRRTAVACDGTAPLKLEATRFPAYLSGLRGLKADVAPFPRGAVKPYAPAADEDLSVVLRVDLDPADFGIAGGLGKGILFRHGEKVRDVPEDRLFETLMDELMATALS